LGELKVFLPFRKGSIVSTSANLPPWQRKESVTIVERAEDEKEAEDEPEKPQKPELPVMPDLSLFRRASSAGEHSEDQFLTVPKSLTTSSSAETLSGELVAFL
jgi:hypothetical protein